MKRMTTGHTPGRRKFNAGQIKQKQPYRCREQTKGVNAFQGRGWRDGERVKRNERYRPSLYI